MFNATRVAVAASILALVGGLSYVTVPTVERLIAPGAPPSVSAEAFAGFTGSFSFDGIGPTVDGERTDYDWGSTTAGDYYANMNLEVSDERLSGTAHAAHNAVHFNNGPTHGVRTLTAEIVNEDGTWEGTGTAFHDMDDGVMRYELMLSGHGAYAGLSAMLSLVSDTTLVGYEAEGVIFPGELPPHPVFEDPEPDFEPATRSKIDPAEQGGYEGKLLLGGARQTSGASSAGEFGAEVRGERAWQMTVEVSDPRVSGIQESWMNSNLFYLQLGLVRTTTDRIVTDEGWWHQSAWGYRHPETSMWHYVNQLTGHGAYEGLSAIDFVSQQDGMTFDRHGVIFPGELPPYPDLPPTE